MVWDENRIGFRPLSEADLPLMHRWLNTPHVNEWYGEGDGSLACITEHYGPKIRGEEPTFGFLMLVDSAPVGFIQWYMIDDYSEYAQALQVETGAAGVDLFIGEAEFVHRGLGPVVLRKFVRDLVFADERTSCCILGPEPKNLAGIRAYEKAGFRYLKTVDVPGEPEPEYLMRLEKPVMG